MKDKTLQLLTSFLRWARTNLLRRQSIYALIVIGLLTSVVMLLSLVPIEVSQQEIAAYSETQSASSILNNPLSLPYKAVGYIATNASSSVRALRAVSIVFFGLSTVALYRILKRWHSDRIALLASGMFASNAAVLSVARLASPTVLLFGWAIVISLLMWLRHGKSHHIAPLSLAIMSAALLYVPGAPYFFALLLILFARKIKGIIGATKRKTLLVSMFVGIVVMLPLIVSFFGDIEVLKQWLLLPSSISLEEAARNVLRVPSAFIYRSPINPLLSVGRLPIFDVASGGLFLVGLYAYQQHNKLERTRVMLLTALLAIVVGALGQVTAAIVIILPFVFAVIASGISYLLDEWYAVFPKNPFARGFGLFLVTLMILMSSFYQLTRFLTVWPNAPETRSEYNQSRLIQ